MPKWIGNRFGSIVPIAPGSDAPSAIYNIFDQYYSRQDGGWLAPVQGHTATGGVISDYVESGPGDVYRAHVFTSSGEFTISSIGNVDSTVKLLVVAGGGGGSFSIPGYWAGAGGGAGGMVEVTGYPVSTTTYPITVGAGGGGSAQPPGSPSNSATGSTGADSSFNNPGNTNIHVVAKGGGGGGASGPTIPGPAARNDTAGGSGGGVGSKPGLSPTSGPR